MQLDAPIARRDDPLPSHVAAREHTGSGARSRHADIALASVRRHPGSTATELFAADVMPFDLHELRRRLGDLKNAGAIEVVEERKCRLRGRLMNSWRVAAPAARTYQATMFE